MHEVTMVFVNTYMYQSCNKDSSIFLVGLVKESEPSHKSAIWFQDSYLEGEGCPKSVKIFEDLRCNSDTYMYPWRQKTRNTVSMTICRNARIGMLNEV